MMRRLRGPVAPCILPRDESRQNSSPPPGCDRSRDTAHERAATALVGARTLEAFARPAWLIRERSAVPSLDLVFRAARPIDESDEKLCQRLIRAYEQATGHEPRPGGMWANSQFQWRQRDLASALSRGSGADLAELLGSMFRSDFVLGMALGSLGVKRTTPWRRWFARLSILSSLTALAESLGAVRMENAIYPGGARLPFTLGLEMMVDNVESALGVSLDFPPVGAPYGLCVAERLITDDSCDQVYAAARIRQAVANFLPDADESLAILEIGGGYGGMAYWLTRMLPCQYTIIDLPIVNVLQGYFLGKTIGPDSVSFYGEPARALAILPTHALAETSASVDVVANKDSMPEIPEAAALDYLRWIRANCSGLFYSYNQEAGAPTEDAKQNVVSEMIDDLGGFRRLRRDYAWARKGYVEEIYTAQLDASS